MSLFLDIYGTQLVQPSFRGVLANGTCTAVNNKADAGTNIGAHLMLGLLH